jgi:AcrR family transcriptional regulator
MDDTGIAPPGMRRTQAGRSGAMRARLLQAATELLREKGLSGFRTADVIERAGVSKGALIHHFPTKDQLIVEVFEGLYRAVDETARTPSKAKSLPKLIEELVADSHAFFFGDSFDVSLNITVAAAREPVLKEAVFEVVRRFRTHTEEVWVGRLIDHGVSKAQAVDAIWIINSLIRGFAVRALWEPDLDRFARLERLATQMVLAHLGPPD